MRRFRVWLLAVLACACGLAQAEGVPQLDEREAMAFSQAVIGSIPPDFTLLDRNSQPVRLSDFRGKPLLISFIYTGCFTICPTQTRTLQKAVRGLEKVVGPDEFNVVSVGFNQPFDTPQAMRAFARENLITHRNWEFLSPHQKHVEALTAAYGFQYMQTPAGFDHIVGVTVVDAEGRINAQVYGQDVTARELGVPLRRLKLWTAPEQGGLSLIGDVVERVRILCTVYDANTGEYRYDWKLVFMLIGGILFFLTMAGYLGLELYRQFRSRRRNPQSPPARGTSAPVH